MICGYVNQYFQGVEMSSSILSVRAALVAHSAEAWGSNSPAPHDDAVLLHMMQRQRLDNI